MSAHFQSGEKKLFVTNYVETSPTKQERFFFSMASTLIRYIL